MKYTGPKNRLSRREGFDLFGKGAKLRRPDTPPGQKKKKGGPRRQTLFGEQLRVKQRIKRFYLLDRAALEHYISRASGMPGTREENLVSLLERRLDNVLYRLGFAKTHPAARQLVRHGHVKVNGKTVTAPPSEVLPGAVVSLSGKAAGTPAFKIILENPPIVPPWLEKREAYGTVKRVPVPSDVSEPLSYGGVTEYSSR